MRRRNVLACLCCGAVAALCVVLMGAGEGRQDHPVGERIVIKVCNWDGVVPEKALDGFTMPAGKWHAFQEQGWQVESYLVAPTEDGSRQGFYAVLKR